MAIAVLTGVLVLVTAYYAWQTRKTVEELQATRGAQVLPRLALSIRMLGGGHGLPRVTSVGAGPALKIDVKLSLEPGGEERRWTHPVMAPGEYHDFMPPTAPDATGQTSIVMDDLTSKHRTLRLRGTCEDALGKVHPVDESIDLAEFWELTKAAGHLIPDDWTKHTAKNVEKIEGHLRTIARELQRRRWKGDDGTSMTGA